MLTQPTTPTQTPARFTVDGEGSFTAADILDANSEDAGICEMLAPFLERAEVGERFDDFNAAPIERVL